MVLPSCTPARCCGVPMPGDAKDHFPGSLLILVISSLRVRICRPGVTAITIGMVDTLVMGVKSLIGSQLSFL